LAPACCEADKDKDGISDKTSLYPLEVALNSFKGVSQDLRADDVRTFAEAVVRDPSSPQSLSAQFAAGAACGWLVKKSLKVAALAVGGALAALSYGGYITVDQERIRRELNKVAAALEDAARGQEAPSVAETAEAAADLQDTLASWSQRVPLGVGFVPGLTLGLTRG